MKNNIIQEDYVSFEVAKLLEEKGFDEECWYWYEEDGHFKDSNDDYGFQSNSDHISDDFICSAPTLQMAMKWLREVHNIHIIIHRYPVKLNYSNVKLWYSEIITLTSPESVDKQFFLNEENDTYEAACEAAIKYCLTNLI